MEFSFGLVTDRLTRLAPMSLLSVLVVLAACSGSAPTGGVVTPVVTISAGESVDQATLRFHVRAQPAPATDLTVGITITADPCDVPQDTESVTILADKDQAVFTVTTSLAAGAGDCTVTATIAPGEGYRVGDAESASTTAMPDTPVDPMTVAPPMVATGTSGPTTVTINWTAPTALDTDLVITGFTVRWREPSDTAWTEADVPSTETTYTIGGLQPGTEYEVQVRAVFRSGDGAWSPSATVWSIPPPPPGLAPPPPPPPRKIYWVEAQGQAIKRANLDGTGIEELVQTGAGTDPAGIALTASKMYWTDYSGDTIKRANLDGTGIETLVDSTDLQDPSGIAVDGGKMYWADYGNDTIKRADLDGSNVQTLFSGNVGVDPSFIALAGGKMYWTERGRGRVMVANLDGTSQKILLTGLTDPQGIAIAGGRIYWTETGSTDTVNSAPLADVTDETEIRDIFGTSSPHGVAVDTENDKVYWVDYDKDTVERANTDGSDHETLILSLAQPRDIAISR